MIKKFKHVVLDGDPRIVNNEGKKDLIIINTSINKRLPVTVQWKVISNKKMTKIAYSMIPITTKGVKINLQNLRRIIKRSNHLIVINNVLFQRWPKGWWATQVV